MVKAGEPGQVKIYSIVLVNLLYTYRFIVLLKKFESGSSFLSLSIAATQHNYGCPVLPLAYTY